MFNRRRNNTNYQCDDVNLDINKTIDSEELIIQLLNGQSSNNVRNFLIDNNIRTVLDFIMIDLYSNNTKFNRDHLRPLLRILQIKLYYKYIKDLPVNIKQILGKTYKFEGCDNLNEYYEKVTPIIKQIKSDLCQICLYPNISDNLFINQNEITLKDLLKDFASNNLDYLDCDLIQFYLTYLEEQEIIKRNKQAITQRMTENSLNNKKR